MLSNWHRRFWLGGATLAILLITAVVMNPWLAHDKQIDRRSMGLDFVAFYTAGTFARQGRVGELYNLPTIRTFQRKFAAENNLDLQNAAPWWNPPIFALVLAPLSLLPFVSAYWTWLAINALCLAAAIYLLTRLLPPECPWQCRVLVPLLVCVSMPAVQAFGHAQNSAISLLILTVGVTLAMKERPILAGVVIGLLCYKPQIALGVAIIVGLAVNWRVWAGFGAVVASLLVVNAVALPNTLYEYVSRLGENLHAIQFAQTYIWERQVTLAAFWRLLVQGRSASPRDPIVFVLAVLSQIILAASLGAMWLRGRRIDPAACRRFMIAGLVAMPLLMPYFLDYDLLLLAVPATLYASMVMQRPATMATGIWSALYVCLWFNPGLGRMSHFNLAVPLLFATAIVMMRRGPAVEALETGELGSADIFPRLAA